MLEKLKEPAKMVKQTRCEGAMRKSFNQSLLRAVVVERGCPWGAVTLIRGIHILPIHG